MQAPPQAPEQGRRQPLAQLTELWRPFWPPPPQALQVWWLRWRPWAQGLFFSLSWIPRQSN